MTGALADADNPFLADFYADRPGAALQTQLFFLLNRHRQQCSLRQADLFSTTGNVDESSPDASHPALEALREADPDALSPRDALELLYRVRKLLS